MLYFICVWSILVVVCLTIGTAILNLCQANCFQSQGDRAIASIWLGIVILTVTFLAISFLLPLSSLTGLVVALVLVILSLISANNRQEIVAYRAIIKPNTVIIYLLIAILVSALTTQQIIWFDTGMYHWVSIKWLREFGTVPGVALITSKLGFNAGWFAFSAPLNAPFLGSHIGAISNGFVFLIAIFHCLIAIKHIYRKKSRLSDNFVLANSAFTISTYTITAFVGSPILISFTPDIPVNLTIGIIAWMMLIITANSEMINTPSQLPPLNMRLIPLILATGTVTMKLSAIPLLAITFLFYLHIDFKNFKNNLIKVRHLCLACLLTIMMLIPMFGYSVVTTGCPLYPSQVMCLDLPWSININTSSEETTAITGIQTSESSENYLIDVFKSRWSWFKSSIKVQILMALLMLSLMIAIALEKQNKAKSQLEVKGNLWLIADGFLGMIFIIVQSPLLRFGLGYFILIPALFLARLLWIYEQKSDQSNLVKFLINRRNINFIVIAISCFVIAIIGHSIMQSRFLMPAQLPQTQVIKDRINDVNYVYPANWTVRCWNTDLPCAMLRIQDNIRLRNPDKGIGAGFVHSN